VALGKREAGEPAAMPVLAGVLHPERGSKPHESRCAARCISPVPGENPEKDTLLSE
jgi:hypothetical protein